MSAKLPIIATLAVAAAITGAGCGDEPPAAPTTTVLLPPSTTTAAEQAPAGAAPAEPPPTPEPGEASSGPAESAAFDPRVTARERAAARTVREYVSALDQRDGAAVCELVAPGALGEVELPEPRGDCAASLAASIGYRDPRGLPVWQEAKVATVRSIEISGDGAKVVATVVTGFADRDEQSVEDDVVYLVHEGGSWLVAKPSSTLYRAVGIADVPPSVLSPPN